MILLEELKVRYNRLLKRHNEGFLYLEDETLPIEEREQKIPAFREIISKMSDTLKKLKANGITATEDEILNGFKIEREVKEDE